jgi:predicted RNA binding protein YcfA (HicA-like mRNA interferase family)
MVYLTSKGDWCIVMNGILDPERGVYRMNRKSPRITAVELLRALKRDGWFQVRQSGSHIIMRHSEKPGCVIVPNHARVVLKQKTLDENLERAGLTKERLWALL